MALFDDRKNQAGLAIRIYVSHIRLLHSSFLSTAIYLIYFFLTIFIHIFVHHIRCVCLSLQYISGARPSGLRESQQRQLGWVGGSGESAVAFTLSIPLFCSVAVVFVGTEAGSVSLLQIADSARCKEASAPGMRNPIVRSCAICPSLVPPLITTPSPHGAVQRKRESRCASR